MGSTWGPERLWKAHHRCITVEFHVLFDPNLPIVFASRLPVALLGYCAFTWEGENLTEWTSFEAAFSQRRMSLPTSKLLEWDVSVTVDFPVTLSLQSSISELFEQLDFDSPEPDQEEFHRGRKWTHAFTRALRSAAPHSKVIVHQSWYLQINSKQEGSSSTIGRQMFFSERTPRLLTDKSSQKHEAEGGRILTQTIASNVDHCQVW